MPNYNKVADILEASTLKQGIGSCYNDQTDTYCAIGAVLMGMGVTPIIGDDSYWQKPSSGAFAKVHVLFGNERPMTKVHPFTEFQERTGIPPSSMYNMNDKAHMTFKEIADLLRNIPK